MSLHPKVDSAAPMPMHRLSNHVLTSGGIMNTTTKKMTIFQQGSQHSSRFPGVVDTP